MLNIRILFLYKMKTPNPNIYILKVKREKI